MGSARPAPVGDVSSPIPPGDGARQRVPAVSVSGDQVTLTPDPGLLADRTTVFPLFIDPPVTLGVSAWGYADQANESRTDGIARVGLDPDGTGLWRSFFSYNISGLAGKAITSAIFRTKLIHSWSCGSTPVNLYRVGSRASGRVNWAGPALTKWLDVRSGHAHKPTGGAG